MAEAGIFTRVWASIQNEPSAVGSTPDVRLSRTSSVFGHVEDSDVAEEKHRIQDTPVETLQQTDSIILKVQQEVLLNEARELIYVILNIRMYLTQNL